MALDDFRSMVPRGGPGYGGKGPSTNIQSGAATTMQHFSSLDSDKFAKKQDPDSPSDNYKTSLGNFQTNQDLLGEEGKTTRGGNILI